MNDYYFCPLLFLIVLSDYHYITITSTILAIHVAKKGGGGAWGKSRVCVCFGQNACTNRSDGRVGLFRTSSSRRPLEEKAHEGGALKKK